VESKLSIVSNVAFFPSLAGSSNLKFSKRLEDQNYKFKVLIRAVIYKEQIL
jgi:hypothetical protein